MFVYVLYVYVLFRVTSFYVICYSCYCTCLSLYYVIVFVLLYLLLYLFRVIDRICLCICLCVIICFTATTTTHLFVELFDRALFVIRVSVLACLCLFVLRPRRPAPRGARARMSGARFLGAVHDIYIYIYIYTYICMYIYIFGTYYWFGTYYLLTSWRCEKNNPLRQVVGHAIQRQKLLASP